MTDHTNHREIRQLENELNGLWHVYNLCAIDKARAELEPKIDRANTRYVKLTGQDYHPNCDMPVRK